MKKPIAKSKTEKKILFVCHGNICRSPMAEFVFKRMVESAGLSGKLSVSSAATSDEEEGNPVYPLAKRTLAKHGIGCREKVARQITPAMYAEYDYVIGMDDKNVKNIADLVGDGGAGKVFRLLDFVKTDDASFSRDVADPWYTRDFDKAYSDIVVGCKALLETLEQDAAEKD